MSELEQAQVDYIHFDVEDGSFISMMIQQLVNKLIQNPNLLTSLTAAKDPKQAFNLIISSVAKEP